MCMLFFGVNKMINTEFLQILIKLLLLYTKNKSCGSKMFFWFIKGNTELEIISYYNQVYFCYSTEHSLLER